MGNISRFLLASSALCLCVGARGGYALPVGGEVAAGAAEIRDAGAHTIVTQNTDRAVVDWQSFDIGSGEQVHFSQPSANSAILNRIHDTDASRIDGKLTANGQVYLTNPNGMVFGGGAQVDVGSLVATTADISNADFMKGGLLEFNQPGNPNASITNAGTITARDAGLLALVAPQVANSGIITAKAGTVALAAGDTMTLDFYGDELLSVAVSDSTYQAAVNSGVLSASGGRVSMTTAAASEVVNGVVANSGIVEATSVGTKNGEIIFYAEGSNAVKGNAAADKGRKSGASVVINSGILDASGRNAGERGGTITVTGDNIALLEGSVLDASGASGRRGTTAGKPLSSVREGAAGGDIKIGGDYLGGGDTPTALNLYVDPGVLVLNDALLEGDAGRSIFWSDGTTQFYGNVYARALGGNPVNPLTWDAIPSPQPSPASGRGGNGGFVETSGHLQLDAGGYVNLTSAHGARGTYFLDPADITIYGNVDPAFASTDGIINLAPNLTLWLDASDTAQVTLTYSTDGVASTASGTVGTNTLTTAADVSGALAPGARIRLGAAGAVTTADTMGADTYTIASVAGTTITTVESLTQTYAAGTNFYRGLVSQWSGKSGTLDFQQATESRMPLWSSTGQNGQGSIYFRNDAFISVGTIDLTSTPAVEAIIMAKNNNISGQSAVFIEFSPNFNSFTDGFFFGLQNASGGGNSVSVDIRGNAGHNIRRGENGTIYINPSIYSFTADKSLTALEEGRILINGEEITYRNPPTHAAENTNNFGNYSFYLGGRSANSLFANTDVSELALYKANISDTDRNLIEQYQSAKWGIALTPPGTGATEVARATAADGYSVFTLRYLERLSQSADISLAATNDITLDLKGDTLNFGTAGRSLTLTAGNEITTASAGAITTNNGAINLTGTSGIVLNHAIGLTTGGGNITLNNATTLGANQNWNAGSGTITFGNTVDGARNLTATAGAFSFASAVGGVTPLSAVSLISTNSLTLPSISAASITAQATGAAADITIPVGKVLTASGAGDAITLASGDDFINNAGAGALSTPAGRWLTYSEAPEQDTRDGLTAGFVQYGCTYGSCVPSNSTGNGFLFRSVLSGGGGASAPVAVTPVPTPVVTLEPEPVIPSLPVAEAPLPAAPAHVLGLAADLPRINDTAPIQMIRHTETDAESTQQLRQDNAALPKESAGGLTTSDGLLTYTHDLLVLLDCTEQNSDASCKVLH